jgi:hypothetical protein
MARLGKPVAVVEGAALETRPKMETFVSSFRGLQESVRLRV